MEVVTHAELLDHLKQGKEAGSAPCRCLEGYCTCVSRATALRYAEAALGKRTPKRMRDAAFWTGFAEARAAQD